MNVLMLVLRIIHISAAIFWGGASLMMYYFFSPTVRDTKQVGQQFAGHLVLKTPFVSAMTIAAVLTVLAGASLYLIDSHSFTSAWTTSSAGLGFGIGGLFGLVAFVHGALFGQLNKKLALLGSRIQGQPTADQVAQIQDIQKKIARVAPIQIVTIIIAILLMSASRYLLF